MQFLSAVLGITASLMERLPSYEQKKKEKFYKLLRKYNDERSKEISDDSVIDKLYDELRDFIEVFAEEIKRKKT